ncbi:MAG: tetratricopeptide repeat protein [bacterium]|nr:tetratricopeptide repeat protein [Candidatus Sumerlaeota bacterium]
MPFINSPSAAISLNATLRAHPLGSCFRALARVFFAVGALAVMLTCANTAGAQSPLTLFNQANNEYKQQRYEEARKLYEQITQSGVSSPQVFYNMGNACARLGRNGEAVICYERARELTPRDQDIAANLAKVAPSGNNPERFILFTPIFWILDHFALREWMGAFLSVFFAAGLIGGIYFAMINTVWRNLMRIALYALGAMVIVAGLFVGAKYYQYNFVHYSVILKANVPVYSGPGERFSQIIVLPEGAKVRRIGFDDPAWAEIVMMDSQKGFTQAQNLRAI